VKSQPHLLTDREKIATSAKNKSNKLGSEDIAHIISIVEMRNKGFIPEVTIWATNPLNNNRDIYLKVNDSYKAHNFLLLRIAAVIHYWIIS
jgi:hypothetical protein